MVQYLHSILKFPLNSADLRCLREQFTRLRSLDATPGILQRQRQIGPEISDRVGMGRFGAVSDGD